LLFTSPAFNNNGAEPGAFQSSFHANTHSNPNNPHHQHQGNSARTDHHRRQGNVKMESELNADLAAQEAAAREYQPHLEVRN
jgi:hypothetical protein